VEVRAVRGAAGTRLHQGWGIDAKGLSRSRPTRKFRQSRAIAAKYSFRGFRNPLKGDVFLLFVSAGSMIEARRG